jgi:hypothetical protein
MHQSRREIAGNYTASLYRTVQDRPGSAPDIFHIAVRHGVNYEPVPHVLARRPAGFPSLDAAIGPLTQSVVMFGTPHVLTDQNPSVVVLQFLVELVALGALVFIVVVAGFNLMLRPHLGVEYHEVRYILPRVCLGGVGIVAAWLCGELIDFSNLLSSATVMARRL